MHGCVKVKPMSPDVLDLRKITGAQPPESRDVKEPEAGERAREPAPPAEIPHDKPILSWETSEFQKRSKDSTFWVFSTLIGVGVVSLVLIFSRDIIGAVVIAIAALVWLRYAFQEPKRVRFSITPGGMRIGNRLYSWEKIDSFWIFFDPPEVKEISFRFINMLSMHLIVPLGMQDPVEVRKELLLFVPEVEQQPSAIDLLMRRIGF